MKLRILDLDNTIADDSWRIRHIDWSQSDKFKRYHKYHSLAAFDNAGNQHLFKVADQYAADGQPIQIAILTARPQFYRPATEEWLRRVGVRPVALFMRPNEDHSSSCDLKQRQLLDLLQRQVLPLSSVECCYDDRPEVVMMYQSLGFRAEVVSIHNICAYTKPSSAGARLEAMGYNLEELEQDSPYNRFLGES